MESNFSCGVDIVSVSRMELAMERSGDRFLRRIFSPEELVRRDDAVWLATRFAAKEAFFKALGRGVAGGVRWKDFSLPETREGVAGARISGRSLALLGGRRVFTSVSATSEVAVAVVCLDGSGDST